MFARVKICVDLSDRMRKYYAAVNSITSHLKNVSDICNLNILETYTLPILKYACESLLLNPNILEDLRYAGIMFSETSSK